jgi:hypothetical protein
LRRNFGRNTRKITKYTTATNKTGTKVDTNAESEADFPVEESVWPVDMVADCDVETHGGASFQGD